MWWRSSLYLRVFTPSLTPSASSLVESISLTCSAALTVTVKGARSARLVGLALVADFAAALAAFTTTRPAMELFWCVFGAGVD